MWAMLERRPKTVTLKSVSCRCDVQIINEHKAEAATKEETAEQPEGSDTPDADPPGSSSNADEDAEVSDRGGAESDGGEEPPSTKVESSKKPTAKQHKTPSAQAEKASGMYQSVSTFSATNICIELKRSGSLSGRRTNGGKTTRRRKWFGGRRRCGGRIPHLGLFSWIQILSVFSCQCHSERKLAHRI